MGEYELWEHFESMGTNTLFTGVFIKWFTSLFAYPSFNLYETQKLWDLYLLHEFDFAVFIKFAYLIFKDHKKELLQMSDIDIPYFCISSQCVITDKNWMLKLSQLKIKEMHLGNDKNNKIATKQDDDDDDEKEIKSMIISDIRSEQSYGEYRVDIICDDYKTWTVWKRYSEFEGLYNKLQMFGMHGSHHPFPSKSWLFKSNNDSLMKSRKITLNGWLETVLSKYKDINKNKNNQQKTGTFQVLHDFVNSPTLYTI